MSEKYDRESNSRSQWEEENLFHTADSFYKDVFSQIAQAKATIHLEIHYIDDLRLGRLFLKKILEALQRGVKVFAIIDGLSPKSTKLIKWMELFKRRGGELSFFNPLPWRIPTTKNLLTLNQRSHKKLILIDKKMAYVGSYNLDTRQMSQSFGGQGWRDIGIRVSGAGIEDMLNGFYDTWKYCRGLKFSIGTPLPSKSLVRLNHKKSWRSSYFKDLIEKINNANQRIWITNPYFVPDLKMVQALASANKRGVDVKIIVPQKSDIQLFPLINSLFYRELVKSGVEVYEYLNSILHAKIMMIDNWIILGSSNLNSRTQKHDWELDIVISHSATKQELAQRFNNDLKNSYLLSYQYILHKFSGQEFSFPFLKAVKYFL